MVTRDDKIDLGLLVAAIIFALVMYPRAWREYHDAGKWLGVMNWISALEGER